MLAPFRMGVIASAVRIAVASSGVDAVLLAHFNGTNTSTTLTDSSLFGRSIVAVGTAQISTAQSKFGGASALFDGSGDFIATSGSISLSHLSTDDFTIEFFVRFTALSPVILITKSSGTGAYPWQIYLDASNKIHARGVGVDGVSMVFDIASATTVTSGAWHHVALTRAGSSFRLFLNGALEASASSASPLYNDTTTQIYIGAYGTGASSLSGNIDELRILKGLALYTAAFTPPGQAFADAPFKATKLLLHMDGVDGSTTFVDSSSAARVVTPFGDAKIVTAQSKFGGASSRYDGNGDYLSIPSSVDFDLGSIYTVEFWVRFNDVGRQSGIIHRGKYSTIGTAWDGLAFSIRQLNNYLRCYFYATNGSTEQYIDTSSITMTVGQWYHVAMVRNGTAGQVFIDGVSAGTISGLNVPAASTYPVLIGDWQFDVSGTLTHQYFYGWLDEVRITKGQALYTANFTPPTQPFPDDPSSGVAFSYTGADQSYTVPAGVTSITVRAWGGGGGSNGASSSQTDRAFGG